MIPLIFLQLWEEGVEKKNNERNIKYFFFIFQYKHVGIVQ